MKERYEQLVKIEQGFFALDCPVILETYAVLRDLKVGNTIALLKFRNCGTEAVARMCLKVQIVDVTGKCVEEIPDFEYKDLKLPISKWGLFLENSIKSGRQIQVQAV